MEQDPNFCVSTEGITQGLTLPGTGRAPHLKGSLLTGRNVCLLAPITQSKVGECYINQSRSQQEAPTTFSCFLCRYPST